MTSLPNSTSLPIVTPAMIGAGLNWTRIAQYMPFHIGMFIKTKLFFVPVCVGIPGNAISVVTLVRSGTVNSSILYLIALAIFDSLNLAMKVFLVVFMQYKDTPVGDVGCRVLSYFANILMYMPIWITLLLTVERFVAVRYPFKVLTMFSRRKALLSVVGLLVVISVVNVNHLFMWYEVEVGGGVITCLVHSDYIPWTNVIFWIEGAVSVFVPWSALAVLNAVICATLVTSSRRKNAMLEGRSSESDKQNKAITRMLITVSVVAMVLLLPHALSAAIIQDDFNYYGDDLEFAWLVFLYWFIIFCTELNSAINFFLYVLSGRRFRRVFVDTFMPCLKRCREKGGQSETSLPTLQTVTSSSSQAEARY